MGLVIASAVKGEVMRLLIVLGITTLVSFAGASALLAQTIQQPGQLGVSLQVQSGAEAEQYSSAVVTKTTVATVADNPHDRVANRLWIASLVSAAAGTSLDAATSWRQWEGNGLLASSDGRFGAKGLALKAGLAGALIVPQICLRHHKNLRASFTAANFAEAGVFTGVSIHNLQVRSSSN